MGESEGQKLRDVIYDFFDNANNNPDDTLLSYYSGYGVPNVYADDRIPTIEEIRKLVEYPYRRIKAIVYTMASSGILIGAWDHLKWGHIRPIQNNNNKDADEIIDEKLIVYAEYDEEYFTFISSEAWRALKDWMNYGEISGELINNYSWVMRDYIKCSLRTFINQQLNL